MSRRNKPRKHKNKKTRRKMNGKGEETETDVHIVLPSEILRKIFLRLHRNDLYRLRQVNSHFRHIVDPLFFQWAEFSKDGLLFRGAPRPIPGLEGDELESRTLPKPGYESYLMHVPYIEMRPHSVHECDHYARKIPVGGISIDVLKITLFSCALHAGVQGRLPGAFVHYDHGNPDKEGYQWDYVNMLLPEASCHMQCHYLYPPAFLQTHIGADKVVVRNGVVHWRGEEDKDTQRVPGWHYAESYILVVDSAEITERKVNCNNLGAFYGLRPHVPPKTKDLTIVFWTKSPDIDWTMGCPHSGRLLRALIDLEGAARMLGHGCMAVPKMIADLATTVSEIPSLERITIVNAAAVVLQYDHGETYQPTNVDLFKRVLERMWHVLQNDPTCTRSRPVEVEFKTVTEWINDSGDWEDAFEQREIRAWLDREAQLGKKQPKKKAAKLTLHPRCRRHHSDIFI